MYSKAHPCLPLQLAAFNNLTALLPLLAQLPASSSRPPSYPVVHLRQIVKFILFPTPSARGGEGEYAIATERAPDAADDDDSLEGETDVFEAMGKLMEDKRDIRWGVYREARYVSSRVAGSCRVASR
jgi:hypothetical protein